MVEFRKFIKSSQRIDPRNLIALYESLDRHTTHTELRLAQRQALELLQNKLDAKDAVLKISTGAGKTLVGLLYLHSQMLQSKRPVAFLCPTVQLVEQVCEEAARNGLPALPYPAGHSFPDIQCTQATAILVCTYDKLFNGRSSFDRADVLLRPTAIVLDDAHAGIDEIRDNFRLTFPAPGETYDRLIALLDAACSAQYSGAWNEIRQGSPTESVEVPYWAWNTVLPEFSKVLSECVKAIDGTIDKDHNWFVWPLVRDSLRWSRCVISATAIELTPYVPPIEKCRAFAECPHRLFMSATLVDDSILVRDLGCSADAVANPVVPASDRGLGERMVLTPSLVDKSLNREWVAQLCKVLAARTNVVVLAPSARAAKIWIAAGAEFVKEGDVSPRIRQLRNSKPGAFVVFAQRYDGVDLPDDSCRVLVIDGLPTGESITDKHDATRRRSVRQRLVFRIEQGMGRAVRSHVDYAVVILCGPEVANFVAKSEVLDLMNPETRAQIETALNLVQIAKQDGKPPYDVLFEMLRQCLARDANWKQYYQENVREAECAASRKPDVPAIHIASAIRSAFEFALGCDARRAADTLSRAMDSCAQESEKAILLQMIANFTCQFDPGKSFEIQRAAFDRDRALFCPPSVAKRPRTSDGELPQAVITEWFKDYANPNGAIAAIEDLRARLSFGSTVASLEGALSELGVLVGAATCRPERELNDGPDVLWLWPDVSLVIEAKSQNLTSIHEKDAGQLLRSLQWFERSYPTRGKPIPVVVARTPDADKVSDFPTGTRVVTPELLSTLIDRIYAFYDAIVRDPRIIASSSSIFKCLESNNLTAAQFLSHYTDSIRQRR